MKFEVTKKESIKNYILEIISRGSEDVAEYVSGSLNINLSTVHRYINELVSEEKIERIRRNTYILKSKTEKYVLSRKNGELNDERPITEKYIEPLINGFPSNVQNIWRYTASEMINNIIDHSEAEELTLTTYSNCLNTTVILQDNGIGIFKKIREYFNLYDDNDALVELSKGKLTTDSENHSGEGIFFTARILDTFYIISGNTVFSCNEFNEEDIKHYKDGTPGTKMILSLSNNSKKDIAEIFNIYSSVDEGFYKTSIPVKNIFPTNPISRSQGKRLCARLNEFSIAELDFKNVDWMGQGFADQVFRVFAKQNPNIKIVSLNMCGTVEKMIKHVTHNNQ